MHSQSTQQTVDLVVLEGHKAGARAALSLDAVTTVGTAFDCDIVLGSPLEDTTQMPDESRIGIMVEGEHCRIQVLQGQIGINDTAAGAGEAFVLPEQGRITLGGDVFSLEYGNATPGLDQSVSDQNPATAASAKPKSRFTTLACTAVLGLCFIVAGVASYILQDSSSPPLSAEGPGVGAQLASAGFTHLQVEPAANNTYKISGRIATRSQHIELKSILEANAATASLDVVVDEILADDITAVYRLSGVDAMVELTGQGEVIVSTATADLELLEQVEQRAYQDVAGLSLLVRQNVPPAVAADTGPADFTEMPGKRIKLVVTSEPAFILTEDGSRYFKGAILPSGYKIKSIFEKTIQLERNDKTVDLIF